MNVRIFHGPGNPFKRDNSLEFIPFQLGKAYFLEGSRLYRYPIDLLIGKQFHVKGLDPLAFYTAYVKRDSDGTPEVYLRHIPIHVILNCSAVCEDCEGCEQIV